MNSPSPTFIEFNRVSQILRYCKAAGIQVTLTEETGVRTFQFIYQGKTAEMCISVNKPKHYRVVVFNSCYQTYHKPYKTLNAMFKSVLKELNAT
jgi:formylmethanofuran dehydrogenase subunit E